MAEDADQFKEPEESVEEHLTRSKSEELLVEPDLMMVPTRRLEGIDLSIVVQADEMQDMLVELSNQESSEDDPNEESEIEVPSFESSPRSSSSIDQIELLDTWLSNQESANESTGAENETEISMSQSSPRSSSSIDQSELLPLCFFKQVFQDLDAIANTELDEQAPLIFGLPSSETLDLHRNLLLHHGAVAQFVESIQLGTSISWAWNDNLARKISALAPAFGLHGCRKFVDQLAYNREPFGSVAALDHVLVLLKNLVSWCSELDAASHEHPDPVVHLADFFHLSLDYKSIDMEDESSVLSAQAAETLDNFPLFAQASSSQYNRYRTPPPSMDPAEYAVLKKTVSHQLLRHSLPVNSILYWDLAFLRHHILSSVYHITMLLRQVVRNYASITLDDLKKLAVDLVLLIKLRLMLSRKRQFSKGESTRQCISRVLMSVEEPLLSSHSSNQTVGRLLSAVWERPTELDREVTPPGHLGRGQSCFKH